MVRLPDPPARGQHWLIDQTALSRVAAAADLDAPRLVVEIGPGRGHLTDHLLDSPVSQVLALEIDCGLVADLSHRYRSAISTGRLRLELADCRRYDWNQLPPGWHLCANLPYYLVAFLLRQLTDTVNQPGVAGLLLSQPVAAKLAGGRGSLLAVIVGFQYEIELLDEVPATAFRPPPRVQSQIVRLTARGTAREAPVQRQWLALCQFGRQSFTQPRQSLLKNLRRAGYAPASLLPIWANLGLSERCRPGELDRSQWLSLWGAIDDAGLAVTALGGRIVRPGPSAPNP